MSAPVPCLEVQGVSVPRLGYGTYKLTGSACSEGVADALALGYRHVDTARFYGNEKEVGEGLRLSGVPRDQVFVTSKVWHTDLAPADLRRATEGSLEELGLEHLDLLLIHWPSADVPLEESLGAMKALQGEGKVRLIGVSNFPWSLLEQALAVADVAFDQVELHPYLQEQGLRRRCREHGVLVTGYKPLANGAVHDDEVLRAIGQAHGKTAAQVALKWQLSLEGVVAIPKAASRGHREQNLDLFDFELSSEELERIAALDEERRLTHPSWGPDWGPGGL